MATQNESDSFESKVNTLASTITRDAEGKIQIPEGTDEALAFATRIELRRRDTQSALSQEKVKSTRLAAENEGLAANWEQEYEASLTADEAANLDELKAQDPDAWHAKLVEIKASKKDAFKAKRDAVATNAAQVSATASRAEIFAAFEADNPGVLTDDKLNNDIPPRYVKQLENGEVDYKQFLQNCTDYLTKGRVMQKTDTPHAGTDLGNLPGGGTPEQSAANNQDTQDYSQQDW